MQNYSLTPNSYAVDSRFLDFLDQELDSLEKSAILAQETLLEDLQFAKTPEKTLEVVAQSEQCAGALSVCRRVRKHLMSARNGNLAEV
jgi:hypothetical protein